MDKKILKNIKFLENNGLRFGQILVNIDAMLEKDGIDLYYATDKDILDIIKLIKKDVKNLKEQK